MNKAPSFQFYPADWLKDVELQSCSLGAQGLMINLMCLMHQSREYGYLLVNGRRPRPATAARLLRCSPKQYSRYLRELMDNGVLKTDTKGTVFCPRMVRDENLREHRRQAGKLGGNPQLLNQVVKQEGGPPSSSSATASSGSGKTIHTGDGGKKLLPPQKIALWKKTFAHIDVDDALNDWAERCKKNPIPAKDWYNETARFLGSRNRAAAQIKSGSGKPRKTGADRFTNLAGKEYGNSDDFIQWADTPESFTDTKEPQA